MPGAEGFSATRHLSRPQLKSRENMATTVEAAVAEPRVERFLLRQAFRLRPIGPSFRHEAVRHAEFVSICISGVQNKTKMAWYDKAVL